MVVAKKARSTQMKQTTVEQGYFNYEGAERFTGLNRVTLWKLVKAGELRASKVGRAFRPLPCCAPRMAGRSIRLHSPSSPMRSASIRASL
jgi:hypothetical protein